uniref:Ovule protein n=1 Tax=Acrobeloides nanus TaxID=290746 RepID=A0A914EHJ6_9BILA
MIPFNSILMFFGGSNLPPDCKNTINSPLFTFAFGIWPKLNISCIKIPKDQTSVLWEKMPSVRDSNVSQRKGSFWLDADR